MRAILWSALQCLLGAMFAVELDKVWDVQTLEGPLFLIVFLVWAALMILLTLPNRRSA